MRRASLASLVAPGALALGVACSSEEPLQGDPFAPNGTLPVDPATDRLDAAPGCDGASCDSGAADSGLVLPQLDGGGQPSNTCQTARAIGTLSGDTGAQTVTANGTCSEWLSFRATEDNSGAVGATMKLAITLKSTGHDFDLYVFFDPTKDVRSCDSPFAASGAMGTLDEMIPLTWGEGSFGNGADEGRTIGIVVLSARGPCPAGATWTLTARGNQ